MEEQQNLNELLFNAAFETNGYERLGGLLKWEEYFKDKSNLEIKNPVYKCTPLWIACNMGNVKQVEMLLAHGADKESFGENGKTCVEITEENINEDAPEYQEILNLLNKEWNTNNSENEIDHQQEIVELKKSVTKYKSENKNLLMEHSQAKKELEETNKNMLQKEVKITILENNNKDFNLKKDEYEIQLGFLKDRNESNNKLIDQYVQKEEHFNIRILELTSKEEKLVNEIDRLNVVIKEMNEKFEHTINDFNQKFENAKNEMLIESTSVYSKNSNGESSDINDDSFYKLANNPNKLVFQIPVRCFKDNSFFTIVSGTRNFDYQEIWSAKLIGFWYGFTPLNKTQCNPQTCSWLNDKSQNTHQSFINVSYSNGITNDVFISAPLNKNVVYRMKFELENGIIMESKVFLVEFKK